jgi:hypothetical protein
MYLKGETKLINIKRKSDGKVVRLKRYLARPLVEEKKIWTYISNSEYREATRDKEKPKKKRK